MFEFLFKYSPTVFRKGEFVFASGWPVWLLVALVLLAGGGLGWYLHRNRGRLQGRQPVAFWSLQLGTVALVLIMLWQPACSIESLRADQNLVAVLLDTSRSMGLAEEEQTRLEKATAALGSGLIEEIQKKFQVRLYGFAGQLERLESVETVAAEGNSSRIGQAVASVLRESAALPLGAVIIFTDGSDNSGNFDRRAVAEIRRRNVPVHTVGIGRTQIPGDIELADVSVSPRALPHSRLAAQVGIRHSGDGDQTTRLSVRDGSRVLASKQITLPRGQTVHTESVDFDAGEAGIRNLTFQLEPLPGETLAGNNALSRVIEVPRARRKILYVEGEPRWEYKFLRRAIRDDANVQLVTMLRTSPNKFYRQGVDTDDELAKGFPSRAEDLFSYHGLVIGSIEAAFFTPAQQEAIKEFVNRRGGKLLMLGGRRGLGDGGWGASKVADVLPVRLPEGSTETFTRERAQVEPTTQGRDSLICRLHDDPAENLRLWRDLPPVADYQRVGDLKPGAVPLLNLVAAERSMPFLVLQNYGRGKSMVLASGGTWLWKMRLPHDDSRHHTFWRQLLRSLVAGTPGPVSLTTDRTLYADNAQVKLRAEVRTKAHQPTNSATVTATLTPELGDPLSLELHPSPDEEGIYEADLTVASPGSYRVEAAAHLGDTTLGSDTRHFRREDGVAENFRPEQNRELLEKLAEQTGGRYWTLDQVSGLPDEIRFSRAGITSREIMDLWDMPVLFIILLSLRAAEWLLRRRWGFV